MSRETILSILRENPERYCSGEEISRVLGVSRAAVSKAVAGLRREGYVISSVTNRGYRLEAEPDRLTEEGIRAHLRGGVLGGDLRVFGTIDSTNNYLKRAALEGAPDGTVAVADEQTAGRGRLGRSFQSPPGIGVYLSFLLRPDILPERAVNLTACTAVAMCDALERAIGIRPQIKWTNDVLLNRRKVCGILTEMSVEGETGALQYIVIGIGVNCNQRLEDFPEDIRDIAGSVAMATGARCDRSRLTAEIINAMNEMYADWLRGKWDVNRYRADCATLGREVRVIRASGERSAVAEAVDDDFGLVVRYEDGTRETIFSGEVSVRGLEGYV
ncbi:MAG: biotin--[Oscillospiraceae bacterium]|nr:biotin--[acetyl-CoA-carboxylase] ligase [Oscillospiraceae bacterium]